MNGHQNAPFAWLSGKTKWRLSSLWVKFVAAKDGDHEWAKECCVFSCLRLKVKAKRRKAKGQRVLKSPLAKLYCAIRKCHAWFRRFQLY